MKCYSELMAKAYQPSGFCHSCGYRMDAGTCPECGDRCDMPAITDPISQSRPWAFAFVLSGTAIVLLMIAILVAEAFELSDDYFHLPQILCTIICFVSAIQYLRTRSKRGSRILEGLAWAAIALAVVWLAFILVAIVFGVLFMSSFED